MMRTYMAGPIAGLVSVVVAAVVFTALLVLSTSIFLAAVRGSQSGAIGWDPVSLWRQSVAGKIVLAAIVGVPLVAATAVGGWLYRLIFRRFL